MIERFGRGETFTGLERDPRFPPRKSFHQFVARDEALAAKWENAERLHAEALMEQTGPIADREVIGPDGRHDSGAVQRDKLRIEQRHLRAAALDPARWSKKSKTTIVGDVARPAGCQGALNAGGGGRASCSAIFKEAEKELGMPSARERSSEAERLRNLMLTGQPLPPALYQITYAP